ncbi:hypothetical protein BDV93DRAFT_524526 [Ceratobasidium sp. AG-I]|nr:hypothetical protein BDV93DRAFT_524526 [Ceratobasidium sp. AG-I]
MASTSGGSQSFASDPNHPAHDFTEEQRSKIYESVQYDSVDRMVMTFFAKLKQNNPNSKYRIPSFEDMDEMLHNDQDFVTHLEEILVTRNCFDILKHGRFSASKKRMLPLTQGIFDAGGDQKTATVQAWSTPYLGPTAAHLENVLRNMNQARGELQYANFVPLVQSSGTGKSRAVDEVARRLFTLPFNLRPVEDNTGYPNADRGILACLNPAGATADQPRLRCNVFFSKLFSTIHSELESWSPHKSPQELASAFRTWLANNNNRQKIYQRIIHETETECLSRSPIKNYYYDAAFESAKDLIDQIKFKSGVLSIADPTRGSPVLVLYFDECHTLTHATSRSSDTSYQNLCKTLDSFRKLDLFALFLSTRSLDSVLPPPNDIWASSRIRNSLTRAVQAPFIELPFDQYKDKYLLYEDQHTLAEVSEISFMVRFGRPLWWTRFENGDKDVQSQMIEFARMKLAGHISDESIPAEAQLAVLRVRIGLSLSRAREAARTAENRMVEGHMLLASAVPPHREYVYVGAPSEPIPAEAAAQLMHLNESMHGMPVILTRWCDNGLIPKGDRGELVARLLLTKAHDWAIEGQYPLPAPNIPFYCKPVPLPIFLKGLLGEANAKLVLDATPDNLASDIKLVDSALGKAKVNFTHWCKAEDDSVITQEAAWVALGRHVAWQCHDQQKTVDLVIPLMLGDDDGKKLGRHQVSAILVQIENRSKRGKGHLDAQKLGFFTTGSPEDATNPRPYLTIVLNLEAKSRTGQHNRKTAKRPDLSVSPGIQASSGIHPRYAFSIEGCSDEVYPNILGPRDQSIYSNILATGTYREEHVRSDQESQEALMQMKISWKSGKGAQGSFSHVKQSGPSPLDGPPREEELEKARVNVHKFKGGDGAGTNGAQPEKSGDEGGGEGGDENSGVRDHSMELE